MIYNLSTLVDIIIDFKCHSNNNLLLSKENSMVQNFMMFYTIIHTVKIIISDKVIKLMIFLK